MPPDGSELVGGDVVPSQTWTKNGSLVEYTPGSHLVITRRGEPEVFSISFKPRIPMSDPSTSPAAAPSTSAATAPSTSSPAALPFFDGLDTSLILYPGTILVAAMKAHGLDAVRLAAQTGLPVATIEGVIAGTVSVTRSISSALALRFSTSSNAWLLQQLAYDGETADAAAVKAATAADVQAGSVDGKLLASDAAKPAAVPTARLDKLLVVTGVVMLLGLAGATVGWLLGWVGKIAFLLAVVGGLGMALALLVRRVQAAPAA